MDAIENAIRGLGVDLTSESRPELADLRGCPQSKAFHAEGDVAVHSPREWTEMLGLTTVPVLYHGPFPEDPVGIWGSDPDSEGFVVRTARSFNRSEFGTHVAKWVRAGHVTTGQHWMTAPVVPNRLKFPVERPTGEPDPLVGFSRRPSPGID